MSAPVKMWFVLNRYGRPIFGMRGDAGEVAAKAFARDLAKERPSERNRVVCLVECFETWAAEAAGLAV
jgi:hypothetical protein